MEDLDSLVAENRFLKAQLDNAQEESQTMKETLEKYRSVAEQVHSRKQSEVAILYYACRIMKKDSSS